MFLNIVEMYRKDLGVTSGILKGIPDSCMVHIHGRHKNCENKLRTMFGSEAT